MIFVNRLFLIIIAFLLTTSTWAERTGVVASDRAAFSLDGEVVLDSELSRFIRQIKVIHCLDTNSLLLAPLKGVSGVINKDKRTELKGVITIYKLRKFIQSRHSLMLGTIPSISKSQQQCLVERNRRFLRELELLRRADQFLANRFQDRASVLDFYATIGRKIKHYIYH